MFRLRGDVGLLIAGALVVVAVSAGTSWIAPPREPGLPFPGSTFATGPEGAKAAYLLLARLGYRVQRSLSPIAALKLDPQGDLLVITRLSPFLSAADRRALAAFLENGGVVLAAGSALHAIPSEGFALHSPPRRSSETDSPETAAPPTAEVYRAVLPGPLTRGVPSVTMRPHLRVARPAAPYVAVYENDVEVGVAAARIGQGVAIWWAGPDPLLNRGIQADGHLELLLNTLGPPGGRRIIWDEHAHGYAQSLWAYVAGTPVPAALAQLALLAAVAWFTHARRHLPVRVPSTYVRTSPVEFIDAMARLYGRARAASGAVEVARTRTRRLLAAACGMPASTDDGRLAAAASSRLGVPASTIAAVLRDSAVDAGAPIDAREALVLVQRLQDLAARTVRRHQTRSDPTRP
ncbi:MAG TPA: DUF4350 domain-containing protein [Vicinamibacterales bacterium]